MGGGAQKLGEEAWVGNVRNCGHFFQFYCEREQDAPKDGWCILEKIKLRRISSVAMAGCHLLICCCSCK